MSKSPSKEKNAMVNDQQIYEGSDFNAAVISELRTKKKNEKRARESDSEPIKDRTMKKRVLGQIHDGDDEYALLLNSMMDFLMKHSEIERFCEFMQKTTTENGDLTASRLTEKIKNLKGMVQINGAGGAVIDYKNNGEENKRSRISNVAEFEEEIFLQGLHLLGKEQRIEFQKQWNHFHVKKLELIQQITQLLMEPFKD
ncbi:hypothetical protein HS088_TW16G00378 [Tripterygium wilfordii]|uniref:Uncharacterized protein n=1 Tax=Tripterygium wilfordii TaxID=458696 RepID=A0A7J7CIQ6_TRIWF|nr:hypothetical protein HS088_TW16G00378 [Tripterygium wilfordii]